MMYQSNTTLLYYVYYLLGLIESDDFSLTSYKFNVYHPEVFNTYINIQ